MARLLSSELEELSLDMDEDSFHDLIEESRHQMFPNWNSEQLSNRPSMAIQWVAFVRCRLGRPDIDEEFLMRWAANFRKTSRSYV